MARQKQGVKTKQSGPQSVHFAKFDGIVNTSPRTDIKPTELHRCVNFDIDRNGLLSTRVGRTAVVSGAGYHSLFSDDNTRLVVCNGNLYGIGVDNALNLIRAGVGDTRMSYDVAPRGPESIYDDAIFYTNGIVLGYVKDGISHDLAAPTEAYKSLPLPGQLLGFFNEMLFVCRSNVMQVSDAGRFASVDQRYGVLYLPNTIRMWLPVDDGFWASDEENLYFFSGMSVDRLVRTQALGYPVMANSAVEVDSRVFGRRKEDVIGHAIMGRTWLFNTANGVYWVTKGGQFGNITGRKYAGPSGTRGVSVYRRGNINQFICFVS